MPNASCHPDPVELLLRGVLQHARLLAGSAALAACASAHEGEPLDGDEHSAHRPDPKGPRADAGGDPSPSQGLVDAGVPSRGELTVLSSLVLRETTGCAGRKPAGLVSRTVALGRSKLGDYLARMAHLEAASVFAFERLACELRDHGAPLGLIRAALEARADEVRHAHQIGHLALAHGGALVAPEICDAYVRTLEEIALENAVEGCVRETFGALVGAFQAEHAEDQELKRAMATLAEEEARHAVLSHRVQHWLEPQLSPEARARVRHARERAVFELAREIAAAEDPELRRAAGLPTPELARILLEELIKSLWGSPLDPRRLCNSPGARR